MRTTLPRKAPSRTARDGSAPAMKRIGLVEDDADIAYTIRLNLRKEKRYQVEHYVSGLAALAAMQEKPFDLVILDLNLPDIDGLALCRELRAADETKRVPIIMLTARVEERDKLLGFEIGADDYITKILARLWDYDAEVETRTVDVHIRSLRRKLGDERIETVVGLGYRYHEPDGAREEAAP